MTLLFVSLGAHDLLPTLARVFDHSEESLEAVRRERFVDFFLWRLLLNIKTDLSSLVLSAADATQ